MHIGFYVSGWPLSSRASGVVTYVDAMKQELEHMGHEVSIFCSSLDPAGVAPGVHEVKRVERKGLVQKIHDRLRSLVRPDWAIYAYGRQIAKAVEAVHSIKPLDVFEIEESYGWSRDVQALNRFPVVVRLHGPAFLVQQHLVGQDAQVDHRIAREGAALRFARVVTAPNRSTLDATVHRYGLRPFLASAFPNPFAVPSEEPPFQAHLTETPELLFVGRFDLIKGADMLLQAFEWLARRHARLRLTFAGPDNGLVMPDGRVLKLQQYVEAYLDPAIQRRITYLGQQTPEQISVLRRRAVASLVTSRWENQPYVLLEAMAQKSPVVAFSAGGIAEAIEHGVNGLSAPPGQVEELARQIERLLLEPALGEVLANGGFRYVASAHDPRRVAEASLQVYEQAARKS